MQEIILEYSLKELISNYQLKNTDERLWYLYTKLQTYIPIIYVYIYVYMHK